MIHRGDAVISTLGSLRLLSFPALATLAACGVVGSGPDSMVQTGQIAGGASRQITDVQPTAGFLPKPGLLAAGGPRRAALVYVNPAANLSAYKSVMLEPVAIRAAPGSELNKVTPEQRQALAARFQSALDKSLAQHCTVVTAPSASTVRLQFALTDASQSEPVVNTVTTYTPYLSTAVSAASIAFNNGVGYFTGAASAEGYATNAKTGELLWEAVDRRGGTGSFVKNTLDNWLDVDHAMQAWSEKLASRLQELGICRT